MDTKNCHITVVFHTTLSFCTWVCGLYFSTLFIFFFPIDVSSLCLYIEVGGEFIGWVDFTPGISRASVWTKMSINVAGKANISLKVLIIAPFL